jgi:hypothetical protein
MMFPQFCRLPGLICLIFISQACTVSIDEGLRLAQCLKLSSPSAYSGYFDTNADGVIQQDERRAWEEECIDAIDVVSEPSPSPHKGTMPSVSFAEEIPDPVEVRVVAGGEDQSDDNVASEPGAADEGLEATQGVAQEDASVVDVQDESLEEVSGEEEQEEPEDVDASSQGASAEESALHAEDELVVEAEEYVDVAVDEGTEFIEEEVVEEEQDFPEPEAEEDQDVEDVFEVEELEVEDGQDVEESDVEEEDVSEAASAQEPIPERLSVNIKGMVETSGEEFNNASSLGDGDYRSVVRLESEDVPAEFVLAFAEEKQITKIVMTTDWWQKRPKAGRIYRWAESAWEEIGAYEFPEGGGDDCGDGLETFGGEACAYPDTPIGFKVLDDIDVTTCKLKITVETSWAQEHKNGYAFLGEIEVYGTDTTQEDEDDEPRLGEELMVNGSFEVPSVEEEASAFWSDVPGWDLAFGPAIELHNNLLGRAAHGAQHVELDSQANSGIVQDIETTTDARYQIQFSYAPRPGTNNENNKMLVYWNGEEVFFVEADGRAHDETTWQQYRFEVVARGELGVLEFHDAGTSNAYGSFLDDVSVRQVLRAVDLPPASGA